MQRQSRCAHMHTCKQMYETIVSEAQGIYLGNNPKTYSYETH